MTKKWCASLAFISLGVLVGCHNSSSSSDSSKQEVAESQPVAHPPPADSPLAKVKEGMTPEEVKAVIGTPDGTGSYVTGKAWVPFHYGGDTHRMIWRYKNQGTIVFSSNSGFAGGGMGVMTVDYDPNEKGHD